jgi:replication-associated recombination protein RarA
MPGPKTRSGLDAFVCLSALQKCIRRGLEREAMQFAVELIHSGKSMASAVCNRLEVISHEDVGLADPFAVLFTRTATEQARQWFDAGKHGAARLAIGNAIRLMARAAKSREGDHFAAAIGLTSEIEGHVPTVPDFALDHHTTAGRRKGRGLEHFRTEGAKLVPPAEPDAYEDEAYRLWALKAKRRPKDDGQDGDAEPRLL